MKSNDVKICKKCILPNTYKEVTFNDEGICSYCIQNTTINKLREISEDVRKKYVKEIDNLIENAKKRNEQYDCVVGFSGGKDSSYLLWVLSKKYNLKILAVTIDHGFFPDFLSTNNIKSVPQKLGIDIINYKINSGFMEKFFKYKFENYQTEAVFDSICADCSNILEGSVIKVASLFRIPLVFIGLSPEQSNRYFYEFSYEHINSKWEADYFNSKEFTRNDHKYLWNGSLNTEKDMKVILPFHVWDYNEEEIVKTLEREGLLIKDESNPLKTRCKVLDTMAYIDKARVGYDGFCGSFSDLIRLGKAPREKYYNMFWGENFYMNMEHVNEVVKRLNLDIDYIINR